MNWFYILLRTFPFWGIPLAIVLMATALRKKGKKKYFFLGVVILALSIVFLTMQGHFTAVPFFHQVINEEFR